MREFILRARKGPTSPDFTLDDLTRVGRMEIVAHCLATALFTAGQIRPDTTIHIVLDGPSSPPKSVRFDSNTLAFLGGFDERTLCGTVRSALEVGQDLSLGEEAPVMDGVYVAKRGFEHLVKARAGRGSMYTLQRRGTDIRSVDFSPDPTFVFSDHLSMPKKTDRYLQRLGATPISVGPRMLFASQCIVLVHNELDRKTVP